MSLLNTQTSFSTPAMDQIKVGSKVKLLIRCADERTLVYIGSIVGQSSDGSISQVQTEKGTVWEATEHLRLVEDV